MFSTSCLCQQDANFRKLVLAIGCHARFVASFSYYYLWSIFLMYFTKGTEGMQTIPHTQTAVNNFLGMHRYDAMFQIMVGAWTNPERHPFYANGNALVWSQLMPYRQKEQLPDNFGTTWASGCYGGEMIVHVQGACKIFEHSGNLTFLNASYTFYRELFWDGIGDMVFGYGYDSAICTNDFDTSSPPPPPPPPSPHALLCSLPRYCVTLLAFATAVTAVPHRVVCITVLDISC